MQTVISVAVKFVEDQIIEVRVVKVLKLRVCDKSALVR